jgi:hypothetical protein
MMAFRVPARRAHALVAAALFMSVYVPLGICAEDWQEVFDPFQVRTLRLEMDPADWDRVRFDQPSQSESWVPEVAEALFWSDGESPIRVTVRRKGESDIPLPKDDPQKVSLKIDINELVSGQKWHGLAKLSLENGSETPLKEGFSWILHRLAWEAGAYGYEAAYSGWVRLYINGELKGVFVNAEQRDAQFLRNHGYNKESGTWLYKIDGSASLEVGIGNSAAYEHLCFSPFTAGPGGGPGGGGGCTQPNLEVDLPQWVDMQGMLTMAAVHAFSENRDDLFSHSGKNSYAVDFDPPYPRTRLYFPWDLDTAIYDGTQSIYGNGAYQTELLLHPWFQRVYEQLLREMLDGPFAASALRAVIDRLEGTVGPAFDEDPYVYLSGSAGAFQELRVWADKREANVRAQLTQPWIPRPQFNQAGGEVVAGFNLTMSAPSGAVYYTLDGTDPRAAGGAIAPTAFLYSTPLVIDQTTHVIARAFDGSVWSALPATATFSLARYASHLRITEMMYHPLWGAVPGDEDEYEFLELQNTGPEPLDLSGFYFEGIDFRFPGGTVLPGGAYCVLARNPTAFAHRYPGVVIQGIYWGKLSDSGEKIRLRDPQGNTVISVEYKDEPPWPVAADGLGYSLVLAELNGNPDRPETWRASSLRQGSPGAHDPPPAYGLGVVINEILAHTDPPFEDAIELFNTGSASVDISGWYLSDDFARTNAAGGYDLKKYRIPAGTVLPPGGFKVFYERDFNTLNPAAPFSLSQYGETVYLSSADSAGNLTGYIMGASFGVSARGVSIGRYATSRGVDFVPLSRATFGSDTPASLNEFRTGTGAPNASPRVGPVVINEIMYNPAGGGSEFLEFLNVSGALVDLSGWRVAGADYIFPSGTVIAAGGLMLLLDTNNTTIATFRGTYQVPDSVPIFAHDFVLENEGEALRLEKPNDTALEPPIEMERVRYNDKSPWPTEADGEGPALERFSGIDYGNDPINWRTVQAGGSPGRPNRFVIGLAVAKQSSWKYHASGSNLGSAWRAEDYSDSSWPDGDGILGYGAAGLGTVLNYGPDPNQKPLAVYFRKEFVANDPIEAITNLRLDALYDDGFVLYLNGTEILRSASMPTGTVAFDTTASTSYNSIGYEMFDLSAHTGLLRRGRNILCAEVHQVSPSSDDLLWDASLTYDVSTEPTVMRPTITPAGGGFSEPVQVVIQTLPADAAIYYTLNGTDPDQTSTPYLGAFILGSSAEVRARAYQPGYNESGIASALFVVGLPGLLEVSPTTGLTASGPVGGAFSPASIVYTLANTGGSSADWTATTTANWVSLSATSGTLPAGALTTVTVSINANADSLIAGSYSNIVSFLNSTTGNGNTTRAVALTVWQGPLLSLRHSLDPSGWLIQVFGEPGQVITIQACVDMTTWATIHTASLGPSGSVEYLDGDPTPEIPRFYRAVVEPPP